MRSVRLAPSVLLAACVCVTACKGASPTSPSSPSAVFVGAGDIADCGPGASLTAALLDGISGTVFTTGDHAYDLGTEAEFQRCYEPTWGRHRSRTRPAPGNHDYYTADAVPYFNYFGAAAGPAGRGYYSFDLAGWHMVSLNSNVAVDAASAQVAWLRSDLAGTTASCVLAYWHHPHFSSADRGGGPQMIDVWNVLYEFRADVVLNGHDHVYERFAPQNPSGMADTRGIRQFTIGTGGHAELHPFVTVRPNSEVRNRDGWGVLKLTIQGTDYQWEFLPASGNAFRDSGNGACVL